MFFLALLYKALFKVVLFSPVLAVGYVVISRHWAPPFFFKRCLATILALAIVVGIPLGLIQVFFPEDAKALEHYLTVAKKEDR